MDFPKRIKQHKSQSDSFAILLYKLKDLGIFRSATENDYGIDFEIEIVLNENVIGRYLKAQVKSAEDLYIRADGIPTVGGIKQTTLLYWTELSYRTHVVVFAVDLNTEKIYFTKSVFWQATTLLDGSEKTKTIQFRPAIDISQEIENGKIVDIKQKEKVENLISTILVQKIAFERGIIDVIYAHKTILRNINLIYELYADTWHYDPWTEVQSLDIFKTVLECGKILIDELPKEGLSDDEHKHLFDFDYWAKVTDWSWDDVSNQKAQTPLKIIMPLILDKIQYYSKLVMGGAYYWIHKDLPYLKLVFKTIIPQGRSHEEILQISYNETNFENEDSFNGYIYDIIEQNKKEKED